MSAPAAATPTPKVPKIPTRNYFIKVEEFCYAHDFVLAPIINDVDLDEQTEKPFLVTRFTKKSEEWLNATYYNVRTGKIPQSVSFFISPAESRVQQYAHLRGEKECARGGFG